MKYPEFKLESYLSKREFIAPYMLCGSDAESYPLNEILQLAGEEEKKLWNNLTLNYTETKGHPLLRETIANQYHLEKEQILCFAGAEEGIYVMAHTLLESTDHAIVVTPCYQSLESIPSTLCRTTAVPISYENRWSLDVDRLANAIQPNTKLIVINFPHNPTGSHISHETLLQLIELAKKHNLWLFSDEVYRFMEINPADRLPPVAEIYEKGISLGVMSKSYGLPGLRIGWIACQDRVLLEKMGEMKHYLSICNSAPSEILSLIALKASDKILARNIALMQENLLLLDSFFDRHAEWFEWVRPKGGCIGYPLFRSRNSVSQLADELLNKTGVLILPAETYHDQSNHFRISFGRKSMPEALKRFEQFIETHQSSWKGI